MTNAANCAMSGARHGSAGDSGRERTVSAEQRAVAAERRGLDAALAEDVLDVLQVIVVGGLRGLAGDLSGRLGLAGSRDRRLARGHPAGRRRGPGEGVTATAGGRQLRLVVLPAPGGLALLP